MTETRSNGSANIVIVAIVLVAAFFFWAKNQEDQGKIDRCRQLIASTPEPFDCDAWTRSQQPKVYSDGSRELAFSQSCAIREREINLQLKQIAACRADPKSGGF